MEVLYLIRLFWGWVFPYISRIHTAYIGEYLHFRYLKKLVKLSPSLGYPFLEPRILIMLHASTSFNEYAFLDAPNGGHKR